MAASFVTVAVVCVVFAPTIVHLLAPGFRDEGERNSLAVAFVRLSVPYVAVSGIMAVAASALNAHGRVGAAAFGLVVFNGVLVGVVAGLIVSGATATPRAAAVLSGAMAVAGLAQLACVGAAWLRLHVRPRRLSLAMSPAVRNFFAQAIPGVVAGGNPQLKLMAGAMVASSSPAAVSWLYYANRLYEMPLGVISTAISAVLVPAIVASLRNREGDHGARGHSRSRWRWRCRPRSPSRCWRRKRSPAACSSAALSGRATPPWWRRRWRRSRRDCRDIRWRRYWWRCRLPMRTRARRCTRRCAGWRQR